MHGSLTGVKTGAKAAILGVVAVVAMAALLPAQTATPERPAWMDEAPRSTGIAVGKKVPAFQLPDQDGAMQDFTSLRGPKGLALYFMRSADW